MAHSQEVLRTDPNGKTATDTINHAELVGVQAWLKRISKDNSDPVSTSKLLTDSQVTLQSIQKAITQPATTWLCSHEPILADIVSCLKTLTDRIHLGKVNAHTGVEGNIIADAAAKNVATQDIIDAGGTLNLILDEDLEAAGMDDACEISDNAHEHHEWPVHPIPEQEGMDEKALLEMEGFAEIRDMARSGWPEARQA